jgi:hypothetical protein
VNGFEERERERERSAKKRENVKNAKKKIYSNIEQQKRI